MHPRRERLVGGTDQIAQTKNTHADKRTQEKGRERTGTKLRKRKEKRRRRHTRAIVSRRARARGAMKKKKRGCETIKEAAAACSSCSPDVEE